MAEILLMEEFFYKSTKLFYIELIEMRKVVIEKRTRCLEAEFVEKFGMSASSDNGLFEYGPRIPKEVDFNEKILAVAQSSVVKTLCI